VDAADATAAAATAAAGSVGGRERARACVCVSVCARVRRSVAALFVVVCVSTGPSILNRDSERAGWWRGATRVGGHY